MAKKQKSTAKKAEDEFTFDENIPEEEKIEELEKIVETKSPLNSIDSIQLVTEEVQQGKLTRRRMRNIIHRIRSNRVYDKYYIDRAPGVRLILEPQFKEVNGEIMNWKNFTFLWDIHPKHPLMAVTTRDWIYAGGKYEKEFKDKDGKIYRGLCVPTAFTHQKL